MHISVSFLVQALKDAMMEFCSAGENCAAGRGLERKMFNESSRSLRVCLKDSVCEGAD